MPAPRHSSDGYEKMRHLDARARNARIGESARRHHFGHEAHVPFLCECDDSRCDALLRLTLAEYEAARAAADYLVAPGHQVDHARIVRVKEACWLYAGEGGA